MIKRKLVILVCLVFFGSVLNGIAADLNGIINEKIISLYSIDTSRCDVEIQNNRIRINPDEFDSLTLGLGLDRGRSGGGRGRVARGGGLCAG